MIALSELRTLSYNILREDENVTNYPYTLVDSFLNSAQLDFCSGLIKNPFTGAIEKKGKLPFLNTSYFYQNIPAISLSTETTLNATTLTVSDTTNYPSAGKIYIAGAIITYTWKTATTFTGCTWVSYPFEAWTQISPVFDLPTDYMSTIQVVYNNKVKLEAQNYDEVYNTIKDIKWGWYLFNSSTHAPFTSWFRTNPFYTIADGKYLILWNLNDSGIIHLRYEKTPPTLTDATDEVIIPNDTHARTILPQYAIGQMLFYRGEEKRAADIINFALALTKQAYTYYNNQGMENQSGYGYKVAKAGNRLNI